MNDPTIVNIIRDYGEVLGESLDRHFAEDAIAEGRKRCEAIPVHFAQAVVTVPQIRRWVQELVAQAVTCKVGEAISLKTGPSLLLLGPTGTGKTSESYGVIRALAETGMFCRWTFTTAADAYARMRPRPGVDAEDELRRLTRVQFLVLDDLGAAKPSEWTEEVNYRLINYRYENELPTLITSNVLPAELGRRLGDRVTSRLEGMAHRVVLKGADRRSRPRASWMELSDPGKEAS